MTLKKAYDALLDSTLRAEFATKMAARRESEARSVKCGCFLCKQFGRRLSTIVFRACRYQQQDADRRAKREMLDRAERQAAQAVSASGAPRDKDRDGQSLLNRLRQENREYQRSVAAGAGAGTGFGSSAPASRTNWDNVHAMPPSAEQSESQQQQPDFDLRASVRVAWSAELNASTGAEDTDDGSGKTLSEEQLTEAFERYGSVLAVLVKRTRSACICFASTSAADRVIADPPAGFKATRAVDAEAKVDEDAVPAQTVSVSLPSAGSKRGRDIMSISASAREPAPGESWSVKLAAFKKKEAETLAMLYRVAEQRKAVAAHG